MDKLMIVFYIYMVISQFMSLYFWIALVKVDSFLQAITVDVLIAEVKGFLWPFFIG